MKLLKLGQLGGMPVKHETVDVVQQSILDVLKAFYSTLPIRATGKYIISGVKQTGNVLSGGYAIVDGELLQVTEGIGPYLKLQTNATTDTFKNSSVQVVIENKFLLCTENETGADHVDDFIRLNGHKTVGQGHCTHLVDRTFSYQLDELVSSLKIARIQGETVAAGFIINRIIPFDGMPNGYELIIKLDDRTGLTFLPKNGVKSNIRFIASQSVTPTFGTGNFIGTLNNGNASGAGYDINVHVKLVWSESEQVWIEVFRNSMNQSV